MIAMVASSALLSVLVTAAAGTYDTTTQRFHCYRIRAGDSATDAAERLTGHRGNLSEWPFEIFDSHRQRVATSRVNRIAPGWTVCLAEERSSAAARTESPVQPADSIQSAQTAQPAESAQAAESTQAALPTQPADTPTAERLPPLFDLQDLVSQLSSADPIVWWFASLVAVVTMSLFALNARRKRRAVALIMQRFGGDFVREFGRPFAQYRGAGALPRARLRLNARRARVEVLVAPSPGRTYPNLSDHRSNVEYDVVRIKTALNENAFATVRPYAEGEWVVLPFQFTGRVN
jgi:hypothetical protein